MSRTALEVLVNGTVLYTVGMENWVMMGASVNAHRQTEEMMQHIRAEYGEAGKEVAPGGFESMMLTSHVGVPDPNRVGSSSGQSYDHRMLKVGDEVTIRVVESDHPDAPNPLDPKGPRIVSKSANG